MRDGRGHGLAGEHRGDGLFEIVSRRRRTLAHELDETIVDALTLNQPTTGSADLSWAANAEPDLAGYKVYIGTQSGLYDPPITLGTVTAYTATNLASGKTYYFCISAFKSASNESPCSAEVSKPLP